MSQITIFKLNNTSGVATMSSLEMVDYINNTREEGSSELRHDHFVVKVEKVLGSESAPKFLGTDFYVRQGKPYERKVYNFPKREAMLMAMSYSYDLQAKVFDAWEAAEKALTKPVALIPNFDDPIEAAKAWIVVKESEKVLLLQAAEAAPKVEFFDAVTANDDEHEYAEAAKILGVGRNKFMKWLREEGYTRKDNTPYQHATPWLRIAFSTFQLPNGEYANPKTFVTRKGLAHFQKVMGNI